MEQYKADYLRYFSGQRQRPFKLRSSHKVKPSQAMRRYEMDASNERILKRIMNPKRDKTIKESLSIKTRKDSQEQRENTFHTRSIKNRIVQRQKELSLILENQRIAKRIIQTPSPVAQSLILSHNYKVNAGVSAFLKPSSHSQFQSKFYAKNVQIYGKGPTILSISLLTLNLNPNIKDDCMLSLQMLTEPHSQTNGFHYKQLKQGLLEIRFCINTKKVGEFLPLRIWRYNGVISQEIGVLDIDLKPYLNSKAENQKRRSLYSVKIQNCRIRKTNNIQTQGVAWLNISLYPKFLLND